MKQLLLTALILGLGVTGCGQKKVPVVYENYKYGYRQLPPEPVYSRLTWAHLPQPVPAKAQEYAPMLQPVIAIDLANSNLEEAIEALAQTIGYNWHYPEELGVKPISIKMVGTVEQILEEIGEQAGVLAELNHERRLVRVIGERMVPNFSGHVYQEGAS